MPILLGAIADDYTGASDLANTLTKNGLATLQTIGVPDPAFALPEVDAVVVSLKIRSIPAADAVAAARAAERWLRAHGAAHVLYKVCSTFDSTPDGNIGPVTDALRAAADAPIVLVTPAFPETGRTVYRGHLFVGDVLLSESPLKDHPLNPMRDSNLVRVLAAQSVEPVGLVDLATVAAGPAAVQARLTSLRAAGTAAAIADAVGEHDLETLGAVAATHAVSTGASGLGLGLARALRRTPRAGAASAVPDAARPVGGFAAIVAGSCSNATLEQIAVAAAAIPVFRLDVERLLGGSDEVAAALAWALPRLADGPVLIAAGAAPAEVARVQARYGQRRASDAIEAATSEIVDRLVRGGVRRLIVAGGETSGAAVDRLGIAGFVVGSEIAPGVPLLRTSGGDGRDLLVALKSGNFGGRDFFARALAVMR